MLFRSPRSGVQEGNSLGELVADAFLYAAKTVDQAVANGVLNGDNGALKPGAPASRAEVAAMLMRFCEKMGM